MKKNKKKKTKAINKVIKLLIEHRQDIIDDAGDDFSTDYILKLVEPIDAQILTCISTFKKHNEK